MINNNYKKGFTLVEVLIVLGILAILSVIIFSTFIEFRKNQALVMDTDTVVEVLRQARNQTLLSKASSVYGVHFTSSKITLFTGENYVENTATNQDFTLNSTDTILTISIVPAGVDVVFNRLTGETVNSGTITVSLSGGLKSKTVTIYKTGLIESQ